MAQPVAELHSLHLGMDMMEAALKALPEEFEALQSLSPPFFWPPRGAADGGVSAPTA